MFEELTTSQDVVAVRLSGELTGDDVDKYRELMQRRLALGEPFGMCVDLTGLSDLDSEALTKGVKADLELLANIEQVRRLAIVSDKQWPRALVALFDELLPSLDAQVFPHDERERAVAWASETPEPISVDAAPVLRIIETTAPNVIGFEMNGVVGPDELAPVIDEIRAFMAKHESVRMLGRVRRFGFSPSVLLQDGLLSMKLAALRKVERYAIVGAPAWIERAVRVLNPVLPDIAIRTFPASAEAAAWDWIGAAPKA